MIRIGIECKVLPNPAPMLAAARRVMHAAWECGEWLCIGCDGPANWGWVRHWAAIVGFPGGITDFSLCLACYTAMHEVPLRDLPQVAL